MAGKALAIVTGGIVEFAHVSLIKLSFPQRAGVRHVTWRVRAPGATRRKLLFVLARTFAKDESGTALEYSLAVAGISFGLIMAMDALDPELRTHWPR
jgi:Flp pilus assembly pilin Flp